MKQMKKHIVVGTVTVALCGPMVSWATNGYFGHGIGMKSMGMGGAGIALAQDATATATNPAAAAFAGNRVDFGINLFRPNRESTVSGSAGGSGMFDGTYDGNETSNFLIPEFGYNRMLNNDMGFGFTVIGRGGMNTDYDKEFGLYSGGSGKKPGIDLAQLYISPAFAMKINNDHAVGITLNLIYQRFKAEGLEGFMPLAADGDGSDLTGNGYSSSTGYSIGIGWTGKVAPNLTLGATYTMKGQMSEFDEYSDLFAEQGDFDVPPSVGVGLAFEATPAITVAFDVTKIFYSEVASVNNTLTPAILNCMGGDPSQCMGADKGAGFGWEDMTVFKLGVNWQYQKDLMLRAGFNHGKQPIPEEETFFNFLAPGVVESHITLGATWTLANEAELTVAYMHAFEKEVKGSGSIPTAFGGGEVDLKMSQDSLGVAYGWKF